MGFFNQKRRSITPAEAGEDAHDPLTYIIVGSIGLFFGLGGYATQIITTETFLLSQMNLTLRLPGLLEQPGAILAGAITGQDLAAIFPAYIFVVAQLFGAIGTGRISELLLRTPLGSIQWSESVLRNSKRRSQFLRLLWWAVFLVNFSTDYLFVAKYPLVGLAVSATTLLDTMWIFPKSIQSIRHGRSLYREAKANAEQLPPSRRQLSPQRTAGNPGAITRQITN